MNPLEPDQARALAIAVQRARAVLRESGDFDPLRFARAYIAAGGPPGADADFQQLLLESLNEAQPRSTDPRLALELRRVREETRWAQFASDDTCVGMFVELLNPNPDPACQAWLERDRGLGGSVLSPTEVVVLAPECGPWRCRPVSCHEVEQ
ncbi:MAG: hypothetical protein LJE84_04475 [Gammaproteobacteria bacterium]|jgi:hypothetical protein|nr:hypothetical protein [Gammaproteobacteria bacterium]